MPPFDIVLRLTLVLLANLIFFTACNAISCYNGSTYLVDTMLSEKSLSNTSTVKAGCDYCSITRSISYYPTLSDAIGWACEFFTIYDGADGECLKYKMTAENTKIKQYLCKCCKDGCNQGLTCAGVDSTEKYKSSAVWHYGFDYIAILTLLSFVVTSFLINHYCK